MHFPNQVFGETIHHIFIFLRMRQAPPHFVVKVITRVDGQKWEWQHSMAHLRKSPYRSKNFADILYTDRVIAFLSKISMPWQQRSVGGKCDLHATFNGPFSKTPL